MEKAAKEIGAVYPRLPFKISLAKAEIDTEALLKDWFESHPDQTDNYCFLSRDFIASLTHLLEPVECWEFHVDEYNPAGGNYVTRMG